MRDEDLHEAFELITEATRHAISEFMDYEGEAKLRGAIVVLDVTLPDPAEPDDDDAVFTAVICKSAPANLSNAHAYGMVRLVADRIASGDVVTVRDED